IFYLRTPCNLLTDWIRRNFRLQALRPKIPYLSVNEIKIRIAYLQDNQTVRLTKPDHIFYLI
ncbi:MAG: hypothetical protein WCJ49_07505, partial [Deltaproteobacteria bacterium]